MKTEHILFLMVEIPELFLPPSLNVVNDNNEWTSALGSVGSRHQILSHEHFVSGLLPLYSTCLSERHGGEMVN